MRLGFIGFFLLVSGKFFGQVVSDDFSDSELDSNPVWNGNTVNFIVNVSGQLQSADVSSGQSFLSTSFSEISLAGKEWSFWVKQAFSGSDNNQSRVYLASSEEVLNYTGSFSAGTTGYYIKLGEAGSSDAILIYRDDGLGNTVELAAGTEGLIPTSFEIRIRVVRDNSGNWDVFADPEGGDNYQWQCSFTDNTYSTTTHFGLVCTYTSSNADNFYFDDIYFGDEIVDIIPPQLLAATAIDAQNLNIQFSEAISQSTAENENNYSLEGNIHPLSALPDDMDASLVHLQFADQFPANISQSLEVSGVTDYSGNILNDATIQFIYLVPSPPYPRAVVFNEVLADENPPVGLPPSEYVELFNASNEIYNLENWLFTNTVTSKSLPTYLLQPGEFVLLCDDDFAALFPDVIGIPGFTALTNSGDSLTLTDDTGQVIDILEYDISWYQSDVKAEGGWSLEQVNPFMACQSNQNWIESVNPYGGTPSAQNSVYNDDPDFTAPFITGITVNSQQHLIVHFSETMDVSSLENLSLEIFPEITLTSSAWDDGNTSILISVNPSMQPGIDYTLIISGLSDCSGNILTSSEVNFLTGESPEPGEIMINEILADPNPPVLLPAAEFIELYNVSDHYLELRGCKLNDAAFTESSVIVPGGFLLVADIDDALAFLDFEEKILLDDFPGLTDSGSELILADSSGMWLDRVAYEHSWYRDEQKDDGGWTLERINPFDPCSAEDNWTASVNINGGTPGQINSTYSDVPDNSPPVLMYILTEPEESITLIYDEPLSASSLSQVELVVNGQQVNTENSIIPEDRPNELILHFGTLQNNIEYHFTISKVFDCWGNSGTGDGVFGLAEPAIPGDLIINEILTDPYEGGHDFVELYNRSSKNISLSEWKLAKGEDGMMGSVSLITERELLLVPGGYCAVTLNSRRLPEFYPFVQLRSTWEMESFPAYNDDSGVVFLITPQGEISDALAYNSDMHFGLLNSTTGVTLERIDPKREAGDPTNWHSAAESQGFGTPGYLNSQTSFSNMVNGNMTITPEVFSPDNDGYQDVTTIQYDLNEPGNTGNIFIYSSEGRQIRHLMQNELLGTAGKISWDGLGDDQQLAPIGIYVVYFEFFSATGKVSHHKKSLVLAHRLN